jgi:DNA-binding PadR family transcriptional regulator
MHTAYVTVRQGLLALLDDGPAYGFQLKTRFEEVTGGAWPLNVGQVYTTLDRLARDGLVEVTEVDGQKHYRLTEAGGDELGAWWHAVPADEPLPRDEMLLKTLLALPAGREHALDVVSRQRSALVSLLQAHRLRAAAVAPSLAEAMVADATLLRAEADLRWLDRCESRITALTDGDAPSETATNGTAAGRTRSRSRRPSVARNRRTR